MSIILFFGFSLLILLVGLIYVFLTLRHHWRTDKALKGEPEEQLVKQPDEQLHSKASQPPSPTSSI